MLKPQAVVFFFFSRVVTFFFFFFLSQFLLKALGMATSFHVTPPRPAVRYISTSKALPGSKAVLLLQSGGSFLGGYVG